VVHCPSQVHHVNEHLLEHGVLGGYDLGNVRAELDRHMLVCVTELNTRQDIDRLVATLRDFEA
ncbi:MAG: glycine dehydrogenase, partial [Chloroflexota bacterium]|nr:glycine dehydrogenase [Chloroflexota bacterium]